MAESLDVYFSQVLRDLSLPDTPQNRTFLKGWTVAEGTSALNNPLATTQPEPGATQFNSVGVRNYPDPATGARATAATIGSGGYPAIVEALRTGNAVQAAFGNAGVYSDLNYWVSGSRSSGSTVTSYVRNVLVGIQGGGSSGNLSAATPGLFGSGTLYGAPGALYAGSGAKTVVGAAQSAYGSVTGTIDSVTKAIQFVFSYRFAEILGGVLLLIVGLLLLGRQYGVSAPGAEVVSRLPGV